MAYYSKVDSELTVPSIELGVSGPTLTAGTGAPTASAPSGSIYLRTDGTGASQQFYVNNDGSTTWSPMGEGAVDRTITTKSSAYTVAATDDVVIATSGTWTATLPTAVGNTGLCLTIQNSGTGTITVDGNGSETISGLTTKTLTQWDSLSMMSDGANWIIGPAGGGSVSTREVLTKTATYTATTADDVIVCTANTWTLTLFAAAGNTGRELHVVNTGSGTITIDGNSSETINGSTTKALYQWDAVDLLCTGTGWVII